MIQQKVTGILYIDNKAALQEVSEAKHTLFTMTYFLLVINKVVGGTGLEPATPTMSM